MIRSIFIGLVFTSMASGLLADERDSIDMSWLPMTPEVQTYSLSGKYGEGMIQVSLLRSGEGIEVYMSAISPGFAKYVFGEMDMSLKPSKSKTHMHMDGTMSMVLDCDYSEYGVRVSTVMLPYNQKIERTLNSDEPFIDLSQTLLLIRGLKLKPGAEFRFASVNPRSNSLAQTKIRVISEDSIEKISCYKVLLEDFEGRSSIWVEKGGTRRILRTENADGTIMELVLSGLPSLQH